MVTLTEERRRGAVAQYHWKGHAPKRVAVNRAVFDKVKGVILHHHWVILIQVCYGLFMKL